MFVKITVKKMVQKVGNKELVAEDLEMEFSGNEKEINSCVEAVKQELMKQQSEVKEFDC